jgi:hypothetical protein
MASVPFIGRRGPATDVNRQDRGGVLIEDNSIVANAQSVAVAALKPFHIALPRHRIAVKARSDLLTRLFGESVEILGDV